MDNPQQIPEFGIAREDEERRDGGAAIVFDPETQKYAVGKHTEDGLLRLFSGGVDDGEDMQSGTLREVVEESGLDDYAQVEKIAEAIAHYHNILKNVNRAAYAVCYLVVLRSRRLVETHLEAHEKFTLEWATEEEILENWRSRNDNHDYDHWIYFLEKARQRLHELGYSQA